MMNIAHRGFSSQYPENTLLSFRKALELGVIRQELDLQITKDGHLVVLHDRKVDRTTDGEGATVDLTLEEIQQLDAGSWLSPEFTGNRIPTFTEVLQKLDAQAILVVELKFEGNDPISKVVAAIRENNAADRVVISSFDHAKLPAVKEIAPELPTTALCQPDGRSPQDWIVLAKALGIDTLGPRCGAVDEAYVRAAHDAGYLVRAWGLGRDQGAEMTRLIDLGVDGMTTDCPDILQDILISRGIS
jgi:glycerophosphoryl diester phosphodiesterase